MTVGVLLLALVLATAIYIVPGLPGVPRSPAELKFAVIAEVGDPLVCTGWGIPNASFSPYTEYPRIVANLPTYLAILRHTKLPPGPLTDDQVVTVYRAWLKLEAGLLQAEFRRVNGRPGEPRCGPMQRWKCQDSLPWSCTVT